MDLSTLKPAQEAQRLDLLHPVTRKPLGTAEKPVYVLVYGKDSDAFRSAQKELIDKRLSDSQQRLATTLTADEQENTNLTLLSKSLAGWEGIDWDGKPLSFGPNNAVMVLRALPWLKEQVDAFIGDRSAFLKG